METPAFIGFRVRALVCDACSRNWVRLQGFHDPEHFAP